MTRALVIAACLLAGGCQASLPEPRALTRGFQSEAGVLAPYDDGKLHLAAGRYGLAVQRFGQALASDRRSLDALNGLAIAYTRLGRFDIAQGYFERALGIDAFDPPTLNNYGRALLEQGRLRDAGPFLQLALQHASPAEMTVVAANVGSLRQARPAALVAALRTTETPPASDRGRLIRLAATRYRLATPEPSRPDPAVDAGPPTALRAVLGAPQQRALAAAPARVAVGVAGGDDGAGRALAAAADVAALARDPSKLAVEPHAGGARAALLSRSWAGRHAAAPVATRGEPT